VSGPSANPPERGGLTSRAWKILAAGLLLREAFSFWTGHPYDFEVWIRTGYEVAHGTNPYNGFWPAVPGVSISYPTTPLPAAAYPPFWAVTLGALYRLWEVVGGGNRFVLYFLLKQPGILADVGTAYLLGRIARHWTSDARAAVALVAFWSFFPYAIIITAIWGQFDSIVVLVLLALLFVGDSVRRNVLEGLGIFVKWVTVIFLPLEALRERGLRRLGFLIALAVPLALTVLVFVAFGWSFTQLTPLSTSQSHGGGLGMNLAFPLTLPWVMTDLSPVPYLYTAVPYAWVPGVLLASWPASRWVRAKTPNAELRAMLLIITVFLLLRWGLYEQYMLYLFSLGALDVAVFHPGRRPFFLFTVGLSLVYLFVNNDLGLRFLAPVDPGILSLTMAADASATWGVARIWVLTALAVLVTVTLVQWIVAFLRDQPEPRPWLLGGRRFFPPSPAGDPTP
jgi:hypothetical protein